MHRRRPITVLVVAAVLAAPAAARAGVFPGEVIDGPSADIVRVGDVDLARDGTGAVVYVRKDGGTDHIFVARLFAGAWQPPERVDVGIDAAGSAPAVAASDGGRLAIAFVSGGSLYAVVRLGGDSPLGAPQLIGAPASAPAMDMSINGAGYITYTSGSDVRAARLERTASAFTELGAVLDVDPAQPAGDTAARRSDVAVSADGTGLAVWGERGGDGQGHVYARRLYDGSISTAPQDLTLSDYQGHAGGTADSPDVDIEDDSSYAWVVFRQALDGTPRAVARRLVGSAFEAPAVVDGQGFPATEGVDAPALDLNGTGAGLVVTAGSSSHAVYVAPLEDDTFGKGAIRVDGAPVDIVGAKPLSGVAQSGNGFVSWLQSTGPSDAVTLRGRVYDVKKGFDPEGALSNPDFGAVDTSAGYDAAADRVNDAAAVAIQGTGAERRLVAGMIDRPPSAFVGYTAQKVRRFNGLRWGAAFDLWGRPTYTVELDGQPAAQTQETKWLPPQAVPDGIHRWRVVATDRRGQAATSPTRLLRVDNTPPVLAVRVSGTRRAGRLLKFRFNAGDVLNPGAAGLARIRVVWGDGSPPVLSAKTAAHRYPRGTFTLRVSATDKAGNYVIVTKRLVVKKRKK
ncbi:MAG TPA: hypothetical protein VGJ32_05075 [Solirubrobacteraceae bacterium]